jgi:hypothetical protein
MKAWPRTTASLGWCDDPRQDQAKRGSLAGFAFEIEPATQTIRDDRVDDMQANSDVAPIALGREEGIEGVAPDAERHSAAIV